MAKTLVDWHSVLTVDTVMERVAKDGASVLFGLALRVALSSNVFRLMERESNGVTGSSNTILG
jgi:hypothetical protein